MNHSEQHHLLAAVWTRQNSATYWLLYEPVGHQPLLSTSTTATWLMSWRQQSERGAARVWQKAVHASWQADNGGPLKITHWLLLLCLAAFVLSYSLCIQLAQNGGLQAMVVFMSGWCHPWLQHCSLQYIGLVTVAALPGSNALTNTQSEYDLTDLPS